MRRTVISGVLGGALAASVGIVQPPALALQAPQNDNFANAAPMPAEGATYAGTNEGATAQTGEPNHAGSEFGEAFHSIWYSWTPTRSGPAKISTCGSDFDTRLGVYTGSSVSALTPVASNEDGSDASCTSPKFAVTMFPATAGTTYYFAVDTSGGLGADRSGPSQGTAMVKLTPMGDEPPPPAEAPPNDDFNNGTVILSKGETVTGTNEGATTETGEPNHGRSIVGAAAHSVWWSWTATDSGEAKIATCGSTFDTRLGVYTGDAVNALTEVAWNEDGNDPSCAAPQIALVTFDATAGTTYRIAVDTSDGLPQSDGSFGKPTGDIRLTLTAPTGPPVDDDTNPSTAATEQPYTFKMLRLKPLCSEVSSKSGDDCPRKATNLRFYSAEPYQNWNNRQDSVRRWVDKLRASGADITLVMRPMPSSGQEGAVMKYLRGRGNGGEVLSQNIEPGTRVSTTADNPVLLKIGYFDPAEDQKILDAILAALKKAGEERKNVKSPCEFVNTDASFDAIERKLTEAIGAGTVTQKRAGEILKQYGCGYEVAKYVDGGGFTTDVVLDVVGVDKQRHLIQLKVALPVAQDLAFVISEEPEFAGTNILGLGLDGKLTASSSQQNRITVQVIERTTGRLVPGVKLEFFDTQGRPVAETTNQWGEWTFTSLMPTPGRYQLKATFKGANGASVVGFRSIDVVDRRSSYTTMAGRTMSWNGSSYTGTQSDVDLAKQLEVVPGILGTGIAGAPTAPPQVQQITVAKPSGSGFVAGQHNAVHLPNDTNYLVGSASGLVTIGGGYSNQVANGQSTTARLAWPNPFQQAANWLAGVVSGLNKAFESGEGTVTEKTSSADKQKIAATTSALINNGAQPSGSGLISDKGLGLIGQAGGNIISTDGAGVIATGGLNLRDAAGNLIGQAGGNVIATGGLNGPTRPRAGTGLFIGASNVISMQKDMMPVYGGNVLASR